MLAPTPQPIRVLFALHPTFDTLDYAGPLETLSHAKDPQSQTRLFETTTTAVSPLTTSEQGMLVTRNIPISSAHSTLSSYDVLIIPGGGSNLVLSGPDANVNEGEPMELIKAFVSLPKKADGSIRTLLSVCTGSLFLAEAGVLGADCRVTKATTHPGYYGRFWG